MAWKLEDNSVEVMNALDDIERTWLEDSTRILHRQVVQNNRVDTGQTKSSWKKYVSGNKGIVGSTSQNALWEEFGTGHYAVNGDGRKGAWYVPVEGYTGYKKPTFNGKVIIVHGKGGKEFYKTNGKAPSRPLENARATVEKKIKKRLMDLGKGL